MSKIYSHSFLFCMAAMCLSAQQLDQQPAQTSWPLRLNEIQIIGSHNSYHAGLGPNEMAWLRQANPRAADALDYRHPPLAVQLDAGVRQLELDIYGDVKGGLFANPAAPGLMAKAGYPADPPFDPLGIMQKPGFKVLHVQDVDFRSNCEPFIACLTTIRDWSKSHPGHLPIFILVENKDDRPRTDYMMTPEPLTTATFDALDAEIRSVFQASELITPDDIRGARRSLEETILTTGWPSLDRVRGKVIFLLDQNRVGALYTKGHPTLEGRVLFTNAQPGTPDAAFIEVNDAITDPNRIPSLVRKGYLVRTMTDPAPERIRANDTLRRDASMASGAQILSTDYPYDEAAGSGYAVRFDREKARCNPVLKSAACNAAVIREFSQPAKVSVTYP
jgi:Phosphoinositide phospholipase C, Ca2+-dependent